jgi:hypothetical protein
VPWCRLRGREGDLIAEVGVDHGAVGAHLGGGSARDDLPVGHDVDALAEPGQEGEVVLDEQDTGAAPGQRPDRAREPFRERGADPGGRLVQQDQDRVEPRRLRRR